MLVTQFQSLIQDGSGARLIFQVLSERLCHDKNLPNFIPELEQSHTSEGEQQRPMGKIRLPCKAFPDTYIRTQFQFLLKKRLDLFGEK